MASVEYSNVQSLLSQYTFEIDSESTNENLKCTMCKRLLIDPHQAFCRCNYCYSCITNYLSDGPKYCCGGKEDCSSYPLVYGDYVQRSAVLRGEIMKAKFYCPNESCNFKDNLKNMAEHIGVCIRQSLCCPYNIMGCRTLITSQDSMVTHLTNDALSHAQLLIQWIGDVKSGCEQSTRKMLSLEGELKSKENVINGQQQEIKDLKLDSAQKESKIENLMQEIKFLQNGSKSTNDNLTKLTDTSKQVTSKIENLMQEINFLQNGSKSTNDNLTKLTDKSKQVTMEMCEIQKNISSINKEFEFVRKGSSHLQEEICEIKKQISSQSPTLTVTEEKGNTDLTAVLEEISNITTRLSSIEEMSMASMIDVESPYSGRPETWHDERFKKIEKSIEEVKRALNPTTIEHTTKHTNAKVN